MEVWVPCIAEPPPPDPQTKWKARVLSDYVSWYKNMKEEEEGEDSDGCMESRGGTTTTTSLSPRSTPAGGAPQAPLTARKKGGGGHQSPRKELHSPRSLSPRDQKKHVKLALTGRRGSRQRGA